MMQIFSTIYIAKLTPAISDRVVQMNNILVDSRGFRRCCITFRIIGFLEFVLQFLEYRTMDKVKKKPVILKNILGLAAMCG
jgi:hypothetical protein